jgi:hypothetical protein
VSLVPLDHFAIAEFRRCGEPAARCALRAAGGVVSSGAGLRCLGIDSRNDAADRLRAYISRSGDIGTLRRIVGRDNVTSAQLADDQVVAQVAAMVERREVCLLAAILDRSVGFLVKDEPRRAEPARRIVTGLTPSQHQPRAASPAAPVAPPIDSLETVDATQQAAVLEDAARDGVPFCAVCEKANRLGTSTPPTSPTTGVPPPPATAATSSPTRAPDADASAADPPSRGEQDSQAGKEAAERTPTAKLFSPELLPEARAAIDRFNDPKDSYGKDAKKAIALMDGNTVDEQKTALEREFGPPTDVRGPLPPRPPGVVQTKWVRPDGTVIRIKETNPPGGHVDKFRRRDPCYSVSVLKVDPTTGLPMPDSFDNEACKVNRNGEAVPKGDTDIDPLLTSGMNEVKAAGFEKQVMDQGHQQGSR